MKHLPHLLLFSLMLTQACDCGGTPVRSCVTQADCSSDQVCVDEACVFPSTSPCASCTADEVCIDEACVAQPDGCIDLDGDGSGENCVRADCDDNDIVQTGTEVCDGQDNDCDGVADNGVLSACGDCDSTCNIGGGTGIGTEAPFTPGNDNSDGVGTDPEGALVLDSQRINSDFIWVANTSQGTVSRYNTGTFVEEGRYRVGPVGGSAMVPGIGDACVAHGDCAIGAICSRGLCAARGDDPSRTSVNSFGDVYVGNRGGVRVSRISILGENCPDTNGDGMITTSSDENFLDWTQDDCVLWTTDMIPSFGANERFIRAVAAQDVEGPDGELIPYVWVGGYGSNKIAKLDGRTGEVLLVTDAPTNPYGFALDGSGELWVSSRAGSRIGRVDTKRCIDEVSCNVATCDGEGAEPDACVKQTITAPQLPYGITVDASQRIWIGGSNGTTDAEAGTVRVPGIARYDRTQPAGMRWNHQPVPHGNHVVNGIAADASGSIWGAVHTGGVVRMNSNDLTDYVIVDGTAGTANKGMAIDADGKVWSILNVAAGSATVITPGAALADNTVQAGVATGITGAYTYSDMTGLQLRLATNPRGHYQQVFEGCEDATSWKSLVFDAEVPPGTSISFRARTSPTRGELDAAMWVNLGTVPSEESPLELAQQLSDAGLEMGRFLMIEVTLTTDRTDTTEIISPKVRSFDVQYTCEAFLG